MNHVVGQTRQELHDLGRALGVVHLVSVWLAMTCDVDNRAGNLSLQKKRSDCHQVHLHSAVRGRIWPEQKYPHCGLGEERNRSRSSEHGVWSRADWSMRKQPSVARNPSRTLISA